MRSMKNISSAAQFLRYFCFFAFFDLLLSVWLAVSESYLLKIYQELPI